MYAYNYTRKKKKKEKLCVLRPPIPWRVFSCGTEQELKTQTWLTLQCTGLFFFFFRIRRSRSPFHNRWYAIKPISILFKTGFKEEFGFRFTKSCDLKIGFSQWNFLNEIYADGFCSATIGMCGDDWWMTRRETHPVLGEKTNKSFADVWLLLSYTYM